MHLKYHQRSLSITHLNLITESVLFLSHEGVQSSLLLPQPLLFFLGRLAELGMQSVHRSVDSLSARMLPGSRLNSIRSGLRAEWSHPQQTRGGTSLGSGRVADKLAIG